MASPNTLKLRQDQRTHKSLERNNFTVVSSMIDRELWRQAMMRTPERRAHAEACRAEMEKLGAIH